MGPADSLQEHFCKQLFIRTSLPGEDIRTPVVVLSGEPCNLYHLLEQHFIEGSLPAQDKWWRCVREAFNPDVLENWRPRVNGVQLKMLRGVRLPETEAEWAALCSSLCKVIAYLRSSSSVDKLLAALRDFAGMVEAWWVQRRAGTGAGVLLNGAGALVLAPAVAASLPPAKRQMLEFVGQSQPAGGVGGHEQQQQQPETRQPQTVYRQPQLQAVYVQPEVITHPILTGGRLVLETSALPLLGTDGSGELQMVGAAAGAYLQNMTGPINDHMVGHHQPAANGSADDWRAAAAAAAVAGTGSGREDGGGRELQNRPASRRLCALNVGGHLFLTTAATLLSFEGSYFWKLVQSSSTNDSSRRGAHHEFFIDRNGKLFEYVLDHLRAGRYGDTSEGGTLPRDARMLSLLKREAAFYCLPRLVEQVQAALEGADGGAASSSGLSVVASETQRQELDAVFVETGFLSREEVPEAQAEILQRLNAVLEDKRGGGFSVVKHDCGAEREGDTRNMWYHVLLQRSLPTSQAPHGLGAFGHLQNSG